MNDRMAQTIMRAVYMQQFGYLKIALLLVSVCVECALAWMRSCPFKIVCWIQVMSCIRQFQHHFTIYGFANNVHRVNDCWLNNTKIFVFLPLFIRCGGRAHFFQMFMPNKLQYRIRAYIVMLLVFCGKIHTHRNGISTERALFVLHDLPISEVFKVWIVVLFAIFFALVKKKIFVFLAYRMYEIPWIQNLFLWLFLIFSSVFELLNSTAEFYRFLFLDLSTNFEDFDVILNHTCKKWDHWMRNNFESPHKYDK